MRVDVNTSGDLEQVTAQYARALQQSQRTVGREVAKVGAKAIQDAARGSRGSLTLSGMRAKLGVKSTVSASAGGADVTLTAKPAGPWTIVEEGAGPHEIRPRRRGSGGALKFGGRFAAHVRHPGTRGQRVWSSAESALDDAIFPVVEDVTDKAMDI